MNNYFYLFYKSLKDNGSKNTLSKIRLFWSSLFCHFYFNQAKFLNETETIDYIIKNNLSLFRFSEGSSIVFQGGKDMYGANNPIYIKKYGLLFSNYSVSCNYLIALPWKVALKRSNFELYKDKILSIHYRTRAFFVKKKLHKLPHIFGDAHLFWGPKTSLSQFDFVNRFLDKKIIFINDKYSSFQNLKLLRGQKETYFVKVPSTDFTFDYHEYVNIILSLVLDDSKNDYVIFISAGNPGNLIQMEIMLDFQCISTGTFFEWM
jgi:hypothetical protein